MTFEEYLAKYKVTPISAREQKVLENFKEAAATVVERLHDEDRSELAFQLQNFDSSLQYVNTDPSILIDTKSWEEEEKKLQGFKAFLLTGDNFEQIMRAGTAGENPPFGKDGELFFQTLEAMHQNFLIDIDAEEWREHYEDMKKGLDWKPKEEEADKEVNQEVDQEEMGRKSVSSEGSGSDMNDDRESVTSENRESEQKEPEQKEPEQKESEQKESVQQESEEKRLEEEEDRLEKERAERNIKRFHMDAISEDANFFLQAQDSNLKGVDPKVLKNAGLRDSRLHSDAAIFDMFVMAKHGVAFKDIPKFERGELEGHDKAKYLEEFKTFLKEHPVSITDENENVTYFPENAKAWGELYRDADKVLSEYRFPDVNLGDPKNWAQVKDDLVLLEKIGTDFVQVIQNSQMESFRVPELNEGYNRGFGSEEAQTHFWANVVTTQNLKAIVQGMGVDVDSTQLNQGAIKNAEIRWFLDHNQDLYKGKTLEEFRKNIPHSVSLNVLVTAPFGSQTLKRLPAQDQKALEAYLENGTPLPKSLENKIKADLDYVKNTVYPSMVNGEVAAGLRYDVKPEHLEKIAKDLSTDANGERIPDVGDMTPEQRKAAELGFQKMYFPVYNLYSVSCNLSDGGLTVYDCIKIDGKPLREHCEAKYDDDRLFGEDRKWADLSEQEKREYMRLETVRATVDRAYQVTCNEFVMKDGKPVLSDKPIAAGRFDQKLANAKRKDLPEFVEVPDDVLKASYFNPQAYVDPIITSMATGEEQTAEINRPPYTDMNATDPESVAGRLYIPRGEEEPLHITDYAQVGGLGNRHIYRMANPKMLNELRQVFRKNADRCDEISTQRLDSKEELLQYGNDLMHQLDLEEQKLNEAKKAKEDFVKSPVGEVERVEVTRMQMVRATEALEKIQKKHDTLAEKVQKLTEELKDLPDAEMPLVYNPFNPGVNKKQKEISLDTSKKELEEAETELAKAKEEAEKAKENSQKAQKDYDDRIAELDAQIANFQKRYDVMKEQIEQDVTPEGYEKIKTKTMNLLKAAGPNRIRRAADGYSPDYMSTKTPFIYGSQAFGPVLDLSREKSITAKVALCSRNDFPLYDAVIVEDAVEQTLVDYWKEKDGTKAPLNPQKEERYRRRLYDQVSQLDGYLTEIYKTLDDPEKNRQLWDMQISDKGNEPWHMHQDSVRGSLGLKSATEAYMTGLEHNWHIDDLGVLANFNFIRRNERNRTLHSQATNQKNLDKYEKPKYKDAGHEKWLNEMDQLWEKVQSTPVTSAEQRKELLEEVHRKIRQGYIKDYVNPVDAKGFHQTYAACRKRDLLIERGLEPAYVETKNLTMSDKGKERLNEIKEFREGDLKLGSDKALGRKSDTLENDALESRATVEEKAGPSKRSTVQSGGETVQTDWEFEKTFEKFNTKRSKIFLGRESTEHENLRAAAEKMRDVRAKIGYPMKPEKLPEYLNVLDEVAYRSSQYQKSHANPNTPAGKDRLKGAVEFESMAKEELLRVKNAMNKSLGTNHDLSTLRTMVAKVQGTKAEEKISELMSGENPLEDKTKEQIREHAATIMAAAVSNSSVEASRNGFQTMGMNAVKKSILKNKEFASVMQDYFIKPGMTAKKMIGELKNGKAIQKMTKLRKNLDINDKDIQKLAEASEKEAQKKVRNKEEPKKKGPQMDGPT